MPKCSCMRTIRGSCAMLFVFCFAFEFVTLLILYSFFTHTYITDTLRAEDGPCALDVCVLYSYLMYVCFTHTHPLLTLLIHY